MYVVDDDQTISVAEVISGLDADQRLVGSHLKRIVDGHQVAVLREAR